MSAKGVRAVKELGDQVVRALHVVLNDDEWPVVLPCCFDGSPVVEVANALNWMDRVRFGCEMGLARKVAGENDHPIETCSND